MKALRNLSGFQGSQLELLENANVEVLCNIDRDHGAPARQDVALLVGEIWPLSGNEANQDWFRLILKLAHPTTVAGFADMCFL